MTDPTFGKNCRLNIGNDRQVPSVDDDDNLVWRTYYNDEFVVFVSPNGEDKIETVPFRKKKKKQLIMHARQHVEDYISRDKPKVKVAGGRYVEPKSLLCPHCVW